MFLILLFLAVSLFGSHLVSPSFAPISDLQDNSKPSFGETCRPDVGCNPGKLVKCSRNHVCECIIRESMVYNRTLDSCVVTAGNICQFDVKVSPRLPKKSVLAPCVNGASCTGFHSKFTCNCDENLKYVPRIGACMPEVHGKVCDGSQDCLLSPLVCSNGACACPNTTVWSELYNDCVITLSNSCNFDADKELRDLKCVPGAECFYRKGPWDQVYGWTCECLEGFQESKTTKKGDHHCYAQYMTRCNGDLYGALSSEQCLPDLHCTTSGWDSPACLCKYDYQQEYNNDAEKCKSLVDGPCEMTSDCVDPEAECRDVYGVGFKQCACKEGYAPWERRCIIGLGHDCSLASPHSCDRASGLECTSKGICECPLLSEFNPQTSTCMPLLGGVCFKDECWPGMVCKPHRGMEYKTLGMCVCAEGYTPTAERKCHKKQ